MAQSIALKKGVYESAKISAKKGDLLSSSTISSLKNHSYEEILKYLEEHGFREVIDKSYLSYEGFYLIEKILNDYLSQNYTQFFSATSKNNRVFLEKYYLKYQIHNVLATLRCMESSQNDVTPYLIGDIRRKEKYIKAFEMSKTQALEYMTKKLGFDTQEVLKYHQKGLFELENYLYQQYYTQLISLLPTYKKQEDRKYKQFIKSYIDLLNARSYFTLQQESQSLFDNLFIEKGNLKKQDIEQLSDDELYKHLSHQLSQNISSPIDIDKAIGTFKQKGAFLFSNVSFGSPYAILGYFFTLEHTIGQIRKLLKAKYMELSQEEIDEVLDNE